MLLQIYEWSLLKNTFPYLCGLLKYKEKKLSNLKFIFKDEMKEKAKENNGKYVQY